MSNLRVVNLAIEVATQQQELAAKDLSQAQHAHDHACRQLDQLTSYASETQARWSTGARTSTSPEMLQYHMHFMERLTQAITLQGRVIDDKKRRMDELRERFIQAQCRVSGLEKVRGKKQAEIGRRQARREQKETDEFAAQRFRRNPGGMQEQVHGR